MSEIIKALFDLISTLFKETFVVYRMFSEAKVNIIAMMLGVPSVLIIIFSALRKIAEKLINF